MPRGDAPGSGTFPAGIAGEVRGRGPHLLWAHGLTGSRANEDAAALFRVTDVEGLTVVRWDAPGHGASRRVDDDETTTWPRLGRLMLEVATGLAAERFVAAGASMGAATSLWAAVSEPARVAAMVLVTPPTAWETRAAQRELYLAGAQTVEVEGVAAYLDVVERRPLNPTLGEFALTMRRIARGPLLGADPVSLAHALRGAAASDLPARDLLARLEIPTLIFSWEGDAQHPMRTGEELAELLPDAVLERAGTLEEVRGWRAMAAAWLFRRGGPLEAASG